MIKSKGITKYGLIQDEHLVFMTGSKTRIFNELNKLNEIGIENLNIVKLKD